MASRRLRWTGAAAIVAVLGIGTVVNATETNTIFDRLQALDAAATSGAMERSRLVDRLATQDDRLEDGWAQVDVALRAAKPIRRDVARSLGTWLGAFRKAEREALDGPVAREDTHRLLRYAADDALPSRLKDVDVIRRADREREGFATLLHTRSSTTVALALADARAETSSQLRDDLVDGARAGGASADLEATRTELDAVLADVAPRDPNFDFHRLKGTLARPITQDPDHRYGEGGALVRPKGLTYRPEQGREIHATGAGEATFVGTVKGWGNVVVLDHGGGYRSVYAHLGELRISQGDRVDRADVIGGAGDSGSLDGVRTYYELRHGAEPVDPEPWIMRY